jgi:hypothetical protein
VKKLDYYCNCINWPKDDIETGLIPMIDRSQRITYKTFLQHVSINDLEELFPDYTWGPGKKGLRISKDFNVSFHRSKLQGNLMYYVRWSGVEYVFGNITNVTTT